MMIICYSDTPLVELMLCSPFPRSHRPMVPRSHRSHRGPTGMAEFAPVDACVRARLHEFGIRPFEVILLYWGAVKKERDMARVTTNDRAVMWMKARNLWELLGIYQDSNLKSRLEDFWDLDRFPFPPVTALINETDVDWVLLD